MGVWSWLRQWELFRQLWGDCGVDWGSFGDDRCEGGGDRRGGFGASNIGGSVDQDRCEGSDDSRGDRGLGWGHCDGDSAGSYVDGRGNCGGQRGALRAGS